MRYQRMRDALLMAIGIAIVANTRPYEGFVLSLTAGVALVIWAERKQTARWSIHSPDSSSAFTLSSL